MLIGDSVKRGVVTVLICTPTILKYFLTRIAAVLRGGEGSNLSLKYFTLHTDQAVVFLAF